MTTSGGGASAAPVDENRRRLTTEEIVELLSRPLVGVFSTVNKDDSIHSVPVHFRFAEDQLKVLAGIGDVKTRNAARTGQATLCVEVTDGSVRSYVSAAGTVTVRQPPEPADLAALDERYSRTDFSSGWDPETLAAAVMLILRPRRWIAWTDWD